MIPDNLDYRYDRRVDASFLQLFTSRGVFRTLTEYALKARYPVDLQFRSNPKTGAQHASLYVGLTTVLDVHWKPDWVKLAAHPSYYSSGFDPAWMSWVQVSAAAEIISGMIDQRQELRLLASRTPRPLPMPEVLPVVAVQRGMSQKHRERLLAVRKHLEEQSIEEAAKLQIYEVTLAGRLLNAGASVLQDVDE